MGISFRETSQGAEFGSLTLITALERVVAERPRAARDAVIKATLARLDRALDELALAIREPKSVAGSRLRADLAEQLDWLVHAGHVYEFEVEGGEVRYSTRTALQNTHNTQNALGHKTTDGRQRSSGGGR